MLSSLRLNSKTLLGKDQYKKIRNILQSLVNSNDSIQFRTPVDWKSLNLFDYPTIIKNPMDLGTIAKKTRQDNYIYAEEVLDDIQLIWDNCKLYNPPQTWIYILAQKLQRSFKKMVKNYLPHIAITVPGRNPQLIKDDKKISQLSMPESQYQQKNNLLEELPYNEKIKFSERLNLLTAQDLGIIVQKIIQKCPSAFKQTGNQNAQLLVDNIQIQLFRQINRIIDDMAGNVEDRVMKRVKF